MAKTLYCWRCKADVPMLEEHEWEQLAPHLTKALTEIKDHRAAHQVSVAEAKNDVDGRGALERAISNSLDTVNRKSTRCGIIG